MERIDGALILIRREALGLTRDDLARMLNVRPDTLRHWEIGKDPAPYRVPAELDQIEADAAALSDGIAARLEPGATVTVWASVEGMRAEAPDYAQWGPRGWRAIVGKALAGRTDVHLATPDADMKAWRAARAMRQAGGAGGAEVAEWGRTLTPDEARYAGVLVARDGRIMAWTRRYEDTVNRPGVTLVVKVAEGVPGFIVGAEVGMGAAQIERETGEPVILVKGHQL